LRLFLTQHLKDYADARNEPSTNATSNLSPYLHFGQISSLEIALQTREYAGAHRLNADAFLEELIVRRELAFNYARFATDLEGFGDLPEWARKTMREHARDERDPVYSPQQLEQAQTYDALWNATQKELLLRGKMHGYYRMYWGKKIIEWTRTYADALQLMIHLHDRYALDGRDPNTYTNILWCFGLHDRPWFQRPIFGVLRYLSIGGMERKTDTKAYIEQINAIAARGTDPLSLATVER
jgi:deoxyribodipyrimidine photo-lyase